MAIGERRNRWHISAFRVVATALLVTPVLAACGVPEQVEEEASELAPTELDYVALGDSYAAMGSTDAELRGPEFCLRASDNYPSHVAADERVSETVDVSCQGAQIPDLMEPRPTDSAAIPAQLDALETSTDVVTLSIGGNDLGFGEIIGCVQQNLFSEARVDCAGELDGVVRQRLAALPADLNDVYSRIDDYSGGARVITTGYLPILSDSQECPQLAAIPAADRAWAAQLTAELNEVLANAAERSGAEFVLPAGVEEHTACAEPEQRWVDITGVETGSHPMHPTAAGQDAMAAAVLDRI